MQRQKTGEDDPSVHKPDSSMKEKSQHPHQQQPLQQQHQLQHHQQRQQQQPKHIPDLKATNILQVITPVLYTKSN